MSCSVPNYIELLNTNPKVKSFLASAHAEVMREAYASGVFRKIDGQLNTYKNRYSEATSWIGKKNAETKKIFGVSKPIVTLVTNPKNINGGKILSVHMDELVTYGERVFKDVQKYEDLESANASEVERGVDPEFYKGQNQNESNYGFESLEIMSKKILRLKQNFNVDVVLDSDMKELGRVDPYKAGETPTVRINPRLLQSDTVIHEFGHIYINLLGGINNKFISEGIDQLRGSELWDTVKAEYPDLNDSELGIEVLATAIGQEGAKLFKDFSKIEKFNNWLSSFFDKLKALIGIPPNRAKTLAREMFGNNLRVGKPVGINYSQLQKASTQSEVVDRLKSINGAFTTSDGDILTKDGIPYNNTNSIIKDEFKRDENIKLFDTKQVNKIITLLQQGNSLEEIREKLNTNNFLFDSSLLRDPNLSIMYDYAKKLLAKFKEEGKTVLVNNTVSDDRPGIVTASTINLMTVSQTGKIEIYTPIVMKKDFSIPENIIAEQSLQKTILNNIGLSSQSSYVLPIIIDVDQLSFKPYKETTTNKKLVDKYLGTVLSQESLTKIASTAKVLVGTLQRKINILSASIDSKTPMQKAKFDEFKQTVTDLADAAHSEVIASFIDKASQETTSLYNRLQSVVYKDEYTLDDIKTIYDYSQAYNTIDDIIDLLRDPTISEELKAEDFMNQVTLIQRNIHNIAASYKEAAKKAFARANKKEGKIFGARRIELEREFNNLEIKKYKGLSASVIKDKKLEYINKKIADEYDTLLAEEEERLVKLLTDTDTDIGALDLWVTDPRNLNDELIQLIENKLTTADFMVSSAVQDTYLDVDESFTKLVALKGHTNNMEELYSESIEKYNGKKTGYYVSEFYSEFDKQKKEVWGKYYAIEDKDSAEALIAYKAAIAWNKENIESKYVDSFQKQLDSYLSEDNSNYKINRILAKYTDKGNVSKEDLFTIRGILAEKNLRPKEKDVAKSKFFKTVEFKETEEFITTKARKEKQLGEVEYNKWLEQQYYTSNGELRLLPMWSTMVPKDESLLNPYVGQPKHKTWKNPQYTKLEELRKEGSPIAEMYDKLISKNKISDSLLPVAQRLGYRLPAIEKNTVESISEQGVWFTLREGFNNLFRRTNLDTDLGEDTGKSPNITGIASLRNSLKEALNVYTKEDGREKKSIAIFYRKDLKNPEDQSYDLATLCVANFQTSKNYSEKTKVAVDLEVAKDLIYERQVNQYTPDGKLKTDNFTGKAVKSGDSNTYKAVSSLLDTRLYGIRMLGDASFNKKAGQLNAWASNVAMMVNYLSAPANLIHGKVTNLIEAGSNQYYSTSNLKKAEIDYAKDSKGLLSDIGLRTQLSKTNVLLRTFNVLEQFDSTHNRFSENSRASNLLKTNSLYSLQKSGEHMIQGTTMYAYLDTIKIKNKEGVELTYTEAVTTKNGKLIAKDGYEEALSPELQAKIASSIARILSHQFGNYSSTNIALIQRYAAGNMVVSLKKFFVGGAKRRYRGIGNWKNKIGEDNYNTQHYDPVLGTYVEGDYVTTFRALRTMQQDWKTLKMQTIAHTWNNMTDVEKSRFKRTTIELAIATTAFALSMLFKGDKDDDEEETTSQLMAAFLTRRLYSELIFWVNPIEVARTLRSPAQSLSFLEKIFRLLGQLTNPLEEYEKGERKGQKKIWKKTADITPIWAQEERSLKEAKDFLYKQ